MELPHSPEALASATWADVAPYYEALATVPLTAGSAAAWLSDWSRLEELIGEAAAVATIEYTCDTENAAKEAAHLRFAGTVAAPRHDRFLQTKQREMSQQMLAVFLRGVNNGFAIQ